MLSNGISAGQFLDELVEEVQEAERVGFELVLVPEHHDGPPGLLADPLMVSAWILGKTDQIRVGPGVLILPLYSIARLGEQAALLQHASKGRLVLGVGAGYQESDFIRFGVDATKRTALLTQGLVSLRAGWLAEQDVELVRPVLDSVSPPPLWLGAWSKRGIERAVSLADGWIADPVHTTAEVAAMTNEYVTLARSVDREPHVIAMRELWVDESDDSARDVYGPVVEPIFRYYLKSGAMAGSALKAVDLRIDGALADRVMCGSIETVTEKLCEFHAGVGASSYVFSLRHPGGPSHVRVLEAIRRLGNEVLPEFQARTALVQTATASSAVGQTYAQGAM